jgi:hypothetical protein
MTAEKIRKTAADADHKADFLREIAAQLAELNERGGAVDLLAEKLGEIVEELRKKRRKDAGLP